MTFLSFHNFLFDLFQLYFWFIFFSLEISIYFFFRKIYLAWRCGRLGCVRYAVVPVRILDRYKTAPDRQNRPLNYTQFSLLNYFNHSLFFRYLKLIFKRSKFEKKIIIFLRKKRGEFSLVNIKFWVICVTQKLCAFYFAHILFSVETRQKS